MIRQIVMPSVKLKFGAIERLFAVGIYFCTCHVWFSTCPTYAHSANEPVVKLFPHITPICYI